ncbi:MAG: hypothetical protein ABIQ40_16185 [Bacteroidia bacterium]
MSEFKKGDCVQLKGGTQQMKIDEIPAENAFYDEEHAGCTWVENNKVCYREFKISDLILCSLRQV